MAESTRSPGGPSAHPPIRPSAVKTEQQAQIKLGELLKDAPVTAAARQPCGTTLT